ncbi:MAG: twin-arginine translocase subunit TatC [Candidatus Nezhaarchaeota archaeon]|nr:twin-arginine translocase subunit TatC [Candidatus Nezhaarchaeota archaeon]
MAARRESELEFQQHLEELLVRARRALVAIVVAMAIVSTIPARVNPEYVTLISVLILKVEEDLLPSGVTLIASTWTGAILTYLYMSLLAGFVLASPIVAYEIYKYVEPALYSHEKRYLLLFTASFVSLLVLGMAFSYFILLPWTYRLLLNFARLIGAQPFFTVDDFLAFTILLMLGVGLTFTFPVVTTLLVKLGILSPETLTSRWREVVVAVFVLAAMLTPDVSGLTMIMLAAPIIALYAVAIVIAKLIHRTKVGGEGLERKEGDSLSYKGSPLFNFA